MQNKTGTMLVLKILLKSKGNKIICKNMNDVNAERNISYFIKRLKHVKSN